ncbi:MAG: hypothetical protein M1819_002439 [Sarea resinae]|nr:MAG: hypothetical protein M1819_002439 [Sarea resinae]
MSDPPNNSASARGGTSQASTDRPGQAQQIAPPSLNLPASNAASSDQPQPLTTGQKRRRHRNKKKRNRRQSFAATSDDTGELPASRSNHNLNEVPETQEAPTSFYRLGQLNQASRRGNLSSTSLESEALLDHRDHLPMRARASSYRPSPRAFTSGSDLNRARNSSHPSSEENSDDDGPTDDRTPLIGSLQREGPSSRHGSTYGGLASQKLSSRARRSSTATSTSSRRRKAQSNRPPSSGQQGDYDVNNPPSVPSSPKLGSDMGYNDVMVTENLRSRSSERRTRDAIVDIDQDGAKAFPNSSPPSPRQGASEQRRHTIAAAEEDVCFPVEGMSEIAEEDYQAHGEPYREGPRRRRPRKWPDLSVLDDWSREEKEERSEGIRAKKISEPMMVGGRLRPQKTDWHRTEEDAPYRFTYFNEEFQSTIHSQTISELLQPGQSFRELFVPEPPELSDESDEEDLYDRPLDPSLLNGLSKPNTRHSSIIDSVKTEGRNSSGEATPSQSRGPDEKTKRYGARPTFWLDVLSPTDAEMRVISKAFSIHPLTAEDIMMQEAREKVELFRHYYFVNYRTFEQDMNSEDFLEPVDMYVCVFREGVISFHFSLTPHPANVRRRIRQLRDYLILSADWISYAIIDDITDAFAPLIQSIENEVDDIDDAILQLHSPNEEAKEAQKTKSKGVSFFNEKSDAGDGTSAESGGDMLRRVGDCRKKVMGLYRLLGNKADVIKGFAKRCNEQWEVAPRSEIGLYLGDIQDHIVTMTGNLSHYEKLLSRAHSNYLAQINIRMNERAEQTNDVLGKLTVLGTIVLPMNIVTGMWGMNVLVPGQDVDNLYWFWSITACLLVFGFSCYFIAKRVYGIV